MFWHWFCWWRPPCLLRGVIVNIKDDPQTAFRAVLWASRGPWLTFKDCTLIRGGGEAPTRIDGEIVLHRDNLAFLQVIP